MKTMSKVLVGTVVAGAMAVSSIAPAAAQDYRHRGNGIDVGDIIAGAVVLGIVIGGVALWALVLLCFGFGLVRGSNTARMLAQFWAAISITAAAITYFSTSDSITVRATLLTLSLDILILLALSSRNARTWTRGKSRRWIAFDRLTPRRH